MKSIYYLLVLTFSSISLFAHFNEQKYNQYVDELVYNCHSDEVGLLEGELLVEMTKEEQKDHPEFALSLLLRKSRRVDADLDKESIRKIFSQCYSICETIASKPNSHLRGRPPIPCAILFLLYFLFIKLSNFIECFAFVIKVFFRGNF